MIKTSKVGFHPKAAGKAGAVAALVGAATGALNAKEDKADAALKKGITWGVIVGGTAGTVIGQGVKKINEIANAVKKWERHII